jgi:hypothetical protein
MKLQELARTIRSKNAGSFMITVEIIFDKKDYYQIIKENNLITVKTIAQAYQVPNEEIIDFVYYDPGLGIKANFKRTIPSGGPFESDVYGCQQYAPLLDIELPDEFFAVHNLH